MSGVLMRATPQGRSGRQWVNLSSSPPRGLVTKAMDLAMVYAAEGYSEFVADFPPKGSRLSETDVVSVRWLAAADHACLLRDEFQVFFVADTARLGKGEGAFIDFECCFRLFFIS